MIVFILCLVGIIVFIYLVYLISSFIFESLCQHQSDIDTPEIPEYFYPFQYQPYNTDAKKKEQAQEKLQKQWLQKVKKFLSEQSRSHEHELKKPSYEHTPHIYDDWNYESEKELLKEAQKHEEKKRKLKMMAHKTHCLNCYTPVKPYMTECPNCGQKLTRGAKRWG